MPPRRHPIFNRLVRRVTARMRQENGDTIIEMAIVLPAFTVLLFGIFQFSLAVASYLSAEYSINVAARYAGIHSNTSLAPCATTDIQNLVKSNLFFANTTPTVAVSYIQYASTGGNVIGNVVNVNLVYSQNIPVPFYNHTFSIGSNSYWLITR